MNHDKGAAMTGFSSFFAFFFLFIFGAGPAPAAENLAFDSKMTGREQALLRSFFQEKFIENYDVAAADLNEDGLREFIVRSKCAQDKFCAYDILAESGDKMISLGNVRARRLELGNGYSGGVRNIITFKDPVNDYDHAVYVWEPASARYMIKE